MTSATSAPRSDLGFRLMKTRRLLSVVLTPSTPMKEETLSTAGSCRIARASDCWRSAIAARSEEHTSELQSQSNLVCRLLLEKKKKRPLSPLLTSHNLLTYRLEP